MRESTLTSLEICAGAGGQLLGLEQAGFSHVAAIELEAAACGTLRLNRPTLNVVEADLRQVSGLPYRGVDLLAGGVPCPPFSIAGKRLGSNDERDLFPTAIRLISEAAPDAVMLENVPGFASAKFVDYRKRIIAGIEQLGYQVDWRVLNASDYGVPQLRPRFILVALRPAIFRRFDWPTPASTTETVGDALQNQMGALGWAGASRWAKRACGVAPTLVGGSKLHGGPDLGPTRTKRAWLELGVDAKVLADAPPDKGFPTDGIPRLTVKMAARLQGFPDEWQFSGKKTAAYRQVGNAFPPPVALAVGNAIRRAILRAPKEIRQHRRVGRVAEGT